ncbi:spore germination protein [Paenibacillus naphthalenovorans]|uniref:spore germination protein n=1 Tax=Paenibacillus naphthalenovorans TaxID=162209 RepID=UPI0027D94A3A|nr:spore germination protein [Paenibacillus naphthalenovorans]
MCILFIGLHSPSNHFHLFPICKNYFKKARTSCFVLFRSARSKKIQAILVAIDGLYEKTTVNENVLKPLMNLDFQEIKGTELLTYVEKNVLSMSSIKKERSMKKGIALLMQGDPILFVDGLDYVYVPGARAGEMRSIDEPVTETTVRGPREGFMETLRTNTSMLRRKIHHSKLHIQQMTLGEMSQTEVAIAYLY